MNYKEFVTGWSSGLPETPCGAGSRISNTRIQRKWIPAKVKEYGILDIADIGAGDLNWMKRTELGCAYRGFDLVPRHPDIQQFDLLTDKLPEADCLMVLWVINHLTADQSKHAASKILNSKSRYLFATWHPRYYNFIDATVIDSVKINNGAELRLIEL